MRKPTLAMVLVLLWAAACDESDPASTNPGPDPSIYSGTFDVDFQLNQTDCNFPPPLPMLDVITVNENNFTWGNITGTWDEEAHRGYGTSQQTCVPIEPPTGCVGCYVIQFDITFATPDSLYGEVIVPYDYNEQCTATDCSSTYDVTGVRLK